MSLLNLLHGIPEELSQSGCHKRCPRGVPEASEGGVEPTGGGGRGERVTRAYTVEVQTASVFYAQSLILLLFEP